jgi:hypothetical protein
MDNDSINKSFQYTYALIILLMLGLFYQVFMVQRTQLAKLEKDHKALHKEGMGLLYQGASYLPVNTGANSALESGSYSGIQMYPSQTRSGFLGSVEPPAFYEISKELYDAQYDGNYTAPDASAPESFYANSRRSGFSGRRDGFDKLERAALGL